MSFYRLTVWLAKDPEERNISIEIGKADDEWDYAVRATERVWFENDSSWVCRSYEGMGGTLGGACSRVLDVIDKTRGEHL